MLRDDFHFRLSLWQRHTRSEPGDNAEKVAAMVGELLLRKRKRNIELVVWIGEAKSPRHDANDRVALFVQAHRAANHVGIGGEKLRLRCERARRSPSDSSCDSRLLRCR